MILFAMDLGGIGHAKMTRKQKQNLPKGIFDLLKAPLLDPKE
jgi:hypothetical protein